MAKKKKKKQKHKVVPTFNRMLERKVGGELEFEWISQDKAMTKMLFPIFLFGSRGEDSSEEELETLGGLSEMIWNYVATDSAKLRKTIIDGLIEFEAIPGCPFRFIKILPDLDILFKEMFPEGVPDSGKVKCRLTSSENLLEVFINAIDPNYLPEGFNELVEAAKEDGL